MSCLRNSCIIFLILVLTSLNAIFPSAAEAEDATEVGWLEKAVLMPGSVLLHAKFSSGTDLSTLFVQELKESERNGKAWVTFVVLSHFGQKTTIEKEVAKVVLVKTKNSDPIRRPIINLSFCIGQNLVEGQVGIVERDHYEQQVEFGRKFLANHFVIDPARSYTAEPECKGMQH